MRRKIIAISGLVLFLTGLPAALFLSQRQQETRSQAAASTTIAFSPETTSAAPQKIDVGQPIALDVFISPGGNNKVSQIKLEITYDATKLTPSDTPFTVNTEASISLTEDPVVQEGIILVAATAPGDPSRALTQPTKVGTINFTSTSPTVEPTQVSFGPGTYVLSFAAEDLYNENVLQSAKPTYISIGARSGVSISPTGTTSPPEPQGTRLMLKVTLGGIEKGATPKRLSRNFEAQIFNSQNQVVTTPNGTLTYNATDGNFQGWIMINEELPTETYTVKLRSGGYLTRLFQGSYAISTGQATVLPPISLVAGDISKDNLLNTVDYNLIQSCYAATKVTSCTEELQQLSDLNDDGAVGIIDLNIFLREFSTKSGD